ncbi:unnamed protein product [Rangifer tarandus platyrhynchus]|uniref:Uncharacterized protein n=1 Tax=Rangifer tarandus platyrhynchus TaxID=3082113 RepID=A0ABN8YHN1_RANTA|nr:unnamed protein product [Rangifer tarandus platyrhynchus]
MGRQPQRLHATLPLRALKSTQGVHTVSDTHTSGPGRPGWSSRWVLLGPARTPGNRPTPTLLPETAPGTPSPQSLWTPPPDPVSSLGAQLGVLPPSALAAFSGVRQEAPALQTNASMPPEASSSKTLSRNPFNVRIFAQMDEP